MRNLKLACSRLSDWRLCNEEACCPCRSCVDHNLCTLLRSQPVLCAIGKLATGRTIGAGRDTSRNWPSSEVLAPVPTCSSAECVFHLCKASLRTGDASLTALKSVHPERGAMMPANTVAAPETSGRLQGDLSTTGMSFRVTTCHSIRTRARFGPRSCAPIRCRPPGHASGVPKQRMCLHPQPLAVTHSTQTLFNTRVNELLLARCFATRKGASTSTSACLGAGPMALRSFVRTPQT